MTDGLLAQLVVVTGEIMGSVLYTAGMRRLPQPFKHVCEGYLRGERAFLSLIDPRRPSAV